jgi:hypothetical protein
VQHQKLRLSPETDPTSTAKNIFRGSLTKDDKYTNKAAEAATMRPEKCTPNRRIAR